MIFVANDSGVDVPWVYILRDFKVNLWMNNI